MSALASAASAHRRRGLKTFSARTAEILAAGWLLAVVFVRYAFNCALTARELSASGAGGGGGAGGGAGAVGVGLDLAEFDMAHLLLVAFLLTFLFSALALGGAHLDRRRLSFFPAPWRTLFSADLVGIATNPMNWFIIPFLVPAAVPLLLMPAPGPALVTMVLSFLGIGCFAWAASLVVPLVPSLTTVLTAGLLALAFANFDFHWDERSVTLLVFQHPTQLSGGGQGLLSALRPWSPSSWIAQAGRGRGTVAFPLAAAGMAVAAVGLCALASRLSYRASTRPHAPRLGSRLPLRGPGRLARERRPPRAPGLLAGTFTREIAFLASTPRAWASAAVACGASAWLLLSREPTVSIALLGSIVEVAILFFHPSNLFGHDGSALRRYQLASIDWGKVFLAKGLAFLASASPLVLLAAAAALRISPAVAASLALTDFLVLGCTVLWGSLSSILAPSATHPGPAGTREARTLLLNQVFPLLVWGIPLLVHRTVGGFGGPAYDGAVAGGALLCATGWTLLIRRASVHFPAEVEAVLRRF